MSFNTIGYYSRFRKVIPVLEVGYQCVTLPFAMPSKLDIQLACLRHAASVHPEPGSNSLLNLIDSTKDLNLRLICNSVLKNGQKFFDFELMPISIKIKPSP